MGRPEIHGLPSKWSQSGPHENLSFKKLEKRGLAGKELQRLCTQQHLWILYHTYTTERNLTVVGQASRETRVMTLTGTKGLCEEPSGFKGKRTPVHFLLVKAVIKEIGACCAT